MAPATAGYLSARALVSPHRVPKSGLWKDFSGAPTAAKAAVGHLEDPLAKEAKGKPHHHEGGAVFLV